MINKVVFAVAGTGLTATAGAGTYFYLTNDWTIKGLFEKNNKGKTYLTSKSADKNQWLENWKKYIKENTAEDEPKTKNNPWNVEKWDTNKDDESKVPDEFATSCEKKLDEKVNGLKDPKYENFVKWCVK